MTQTLTDITIRLNRDYQAINKVILPLGFFVTDYLAVPQPEKVIAMLPKGFGVVFRDYDHENREVLGRPLRALCRKAGIYFLVAGDVKLAQNLSADGLHLPEVLGSEAVEIRKNYPEWVISVACHDMKAVMRACTWPIDLAFVAPVFPTKSHPETFSDVGRTLGVAGVGGMVKISRKPLYALGGITKENARQLMGSGVAGIAAIRGFMDT